MKIIKKLISLHRSLFTVTVLIAFLAIFANLWWNRVLASILDALSELTSFHTEKGANGLYQILLVAVVVILFLVMVEFASSYLATYICELWAHDMRMGYAGYYLQCAVSKLAKLNVGEEQSAMQNELRDISDYLNQNLFSFINQFGTFVVTVVFLLCLNVRLTLVSVLPVLPLMAYCFCTGKVIKNYTEQYQRNKGKVNRAVEVILELLPVIQVYHAYPLLNRELDEGLSDCENANIRKERVAAKLMSLSGLLSFMPLLFTLGWGGGMVLQGEISPGIFYIFINLSGNVSGFLQNMPNVYAGFRRFVASVDRLEGKVVLEGVKRYDAIRN